MRVPEQLLVVMDKIKKITGSMVHLGFYSDPETGEYTWAILIDKCPISARYIVDIIRNINPVVIGEKVKIICRNID